MPEGAWLPPRPRRCPERAEQGRTTTTDTRGSATRLTLVKLPAAAGGHGLIDSATQFHRRPTSRRRPNAESPPTESTGRAIPAQRRLDLSGYPGGFDLVGNHVNQQFQLDAFGEALLLFAVAASHDRLDLDGQQAAQVAAAAIEQRWQDGGRRDLGDRRPSMDPQPADLCRRPPPSSPGSRTSRRVPKRAGGRFWPTRSSLRQPATSLHPSGRWQRSPEDPGLDGALLFPAIRGALPADDPRSVATVAAVIDQLTDKGYAYRFRHSDAAARRSRGLLCAVRVRHGPCSRSTGPTTRGGPLVRTDLLGAAVRRTIHRRRMGRRRAPVARQLAPSVRPCPAPRGGRPLGRGRPMVRAAASRRRRPTFRDGCVRHPRPANPAAIAASIRRGPPPASIRNSEHDPVHAWLTSIAAPLRSTPAPGVPLWRLGRGGG